MIKFKDDTIDETPSLAQVLSSESSISSMLDMSIRSLPGDHGLPLQQVLPNLSVPPKTEVGKAQNDWKEILRIFNIQVLPDVPPAVADAVNRGGEFLATLTAGTPWESVAKEVGSTFSPESSIFRADSQKEIDLLVDVITSWIASNSGPKLLKS